MDPLTHGLLGATLAQAAFAQRLGWRRAAWLGACAAMLPDIDVLAVPFGGPLGEFRIHRAATHALWLAPFVGAGLGEAAWRLASSRAAARAEPPPGPRWAFRLLAVLALATHALLDLMTTYGIQMFWPARLRLALDAVPIVDLLYALPLALALLAGRAWHSARPWLSRAAATGALALTCLYLGYGLESNARAAALAREELRAAGWADADVHAYPTLLQPWLRRVVARRGRELRVGFLSTLLRRPTIVWGGFSEEPLEERLALEGQPDAQLFLWFAMGQVTSRRVSRGGEQYLELEDLRFGYGQRPDQGLWGVRFRWDGHALGPAERFDRPRPPLGQLLTGIWSGAFGAQ